MGVVHRDALMIRSVLLSMKSRDDLGWRAKHELELALDALVDLEGRLVPLVGKATIDDRPVQCEAGHPYPIIDLGNNCLHRGAQGNRKLKWPEEYEEDGDEQ
jgi:hypothetical protein